MGLLIGGFDKVISFSPENIDSEFYNKNKHILEYIKGGGYWLWKSYIVRNTLLEIGSEDYLFYCDSGAYFVKDVESVIRTMKRDNSDVFCWSASRRRRDREKVWTKRDAFILMDVDSYEYTDSPQVYAASFVLRKSKKTINLAEEWLYYSQDERIITDNPNQCGLPNYPGFVANRHDQSIFSLLTKKHQIKSYENRIYTYIKVSNKVTTIKKWYGLFFDKESKIFLNHTRKKKFVLTETVFLLSKILIKGKGLEVFSTLRVILKIKFKFIRYLTRRRRLASILKKKGGRGILESILRRMNI